MAEYELESLACLAPDLTHVSLNHPEGTYQIEIRNKHVLPGEEHPILSALLIFNSESLFEAKEKSESLIKEIGDLLTFATNIRFKVVHFLKLADWTPGLTERECLVFKKFPGDERPFPCVDQHILDSVAVLLTANISPLLKRSLRWFSRGASSQYLDDQFQCFWFALELLSEIYKKTEKVNDKCPKCGKALYCETCHEYPMHKPYSKQALQYLFSLMVADKPDDEFQKLNNIRNAIMHGDDIKKIENELRIKFSDFVDKAGQIAWIAIFNTITNSFKERKRIQLKLLQASSYCQLTLTTSLHILFYSKDPNNPKLEEIPNFTITWHLEETKNE